MSESQLPRPVKWEAAGHADYRRRVYVEESEQRDGSILYAVRDGTGSVLSQHGDWLFAEPMPSARGDAFLAEYRFATLFDAVHAARNAARWWAT